MASILVGASSYSHNRKDPPTSQLLVRLTLPKEFLTGGAGPSNVSTQIGNPPKGVGRGETVLPYSGYVIVTIV